MDRIPLWVAALLSVVLVLGAWLVRLRRVLREDHEERDYSQSESDQYIDPRDREHRYWDRRARRYANVIPTSEGGDPLPANRPLGKEEIILLRVSIGPLDSQNLERAPVAFPDHLRPAEDVLLSVLVASRDFQVADSTWELRKIDRWDERARYAVEQSLLLPAD